MHRRSDSAHGMTTEEQWTFTTARRPGHRPNAGRRRFLKQAGAVGARRTAARGKALASATHAMPPAEATPDFKPDVEIELAAVVDEVGLLPGAPTTVWRFTGKVLRGRADALTFLKSSDDGPSFVPVLRLRRGQKVRIFFANRLPEPSIVHWHGLHIVQRMDGHPMYAIGTGKRYVYEFVVDNRAGTYWFHPHPHERTGFQVYRGLAGFFLVGDDEEDALKLAAGAFDLPLVIQDRTFDSRNQLVYVQSMMERMMGFMGERVLVNATPDYIKQVERTRLPAAVVQRLERDGLPALSEQGASHFCLSALTADCSNRPMTRRTLTLGVGERADVWMDFAAAQSGEEIALIAQPFAPMISGGGGMPMMMGRAANPAPRAIARFRVGSGAACEVAAAGASFEISRSRSARSRQPRAASENPNVDDARPGLSQRPDL
jgi:blue copper oxidase